MNMDNKLRTVFAQIEENQCFQLISDTEFQIYDSDEEQRCFILTEETTSANGQFFKVINRNKENIRFLAVDKCLFFDNDKFKRCDCILYNQEYFCFVELKKVETTRNRNSAKKTARAQLYSTIKILTEKVHFENLRLEAYLCVGYKPSNPATLASSQSAKVAFEDLNTKLYNGCQKRFS
jgi:hypothetical protein